MGGTQPLQSSASPGIASGEEDRRAGSVIREPFSIYITRCLQWKVGVGGERRMTKERKRDRDGDGERTLYMVHKVSLFKCLSFFSVCLSLLSSSDFQNTTTSNAYLLVHTEYKACQCPCLK